MSFNNVSIMGRLTATPELKTTQSGKTVTSFNVAVDNKGKDAGASFVPVVAWNKTAEFIGRYFIKGKMIAIIGHLNQRTYTTQDGHNRSVLEVIADEVSFCGDKQNVENQGSQPASVDIPNDDFEEIVDDDDDLPF